MPEDASPGQPVEPPQPEEPVSEQDKDVGDFINRHVLEKDSVFFEG